MLIIVIPYWIYHTIILLFIIIVAIAYLLKSKTNKQYKQERKRVKKIKKTINENKPLKDILKTFNYYNLKKGDMRYFDLASLIKEELNYNEMAILFKHNLFNDEAVEADFISKVLCNLSDNEISVILKQLDDSKRNNILLRYSLPKREHILNYLYGTPISHIKAKGIICSYCGKEIDPAEFNYHYYTCIGGPSSKKFKESQDWEKAKSLNTIAAYQEYLKQYPNGKFSKEAKDKIEEIKANEESIWGKVKHLNTITAYKEYPKQYPIWANAGSIWEKAKEESIWEKAEYLNTVVGYQKYLKQYPNGKFSIEAKYKIEEAKAKEESIWEKAKSLNTIAAYQEYLKQYPDPAGKFSKEAKDKIEEARANDEPIWEKAKHLNTITAYQEYLKQHPGGKFSIEAKYKIEEAKAKEESIWEKAKSLNTIAAYQEYLKQYPDPAGKFSKEAKDKIHEAYMEKYSKKHSPDSSPTRETIIKEQIKCNRCGRETSEELNNGEYWCSWCGKEFNPKDTTGAEIKNITMELNEKKNFQDLYKICIMAEIVWIQTPKFNYPLIITPHPITNKKELIDTEVSPRFKLFFIQNEAMIFFDINFKILKRRFVFAFIIPDPEYRNFFNSIVNQRIPSIWFNDEPMVSNSIAVPILNWSSIINMLRQYNTYFGHRYFEV